jgi:hypothetical protein
VCEKAKLFRGLLDTPERCPECGYIFMRESGYFLPHVAIGYVVTTLTALAVWPVLRYIGGVQSNRVILTSMVLTAIGFGLWFIRYAKMLWLVIDLSVHPPSREDFQSRGRR